MSAPVAFIFQNHCQNGYQRSFLQSNWRRNRAGLWGPTSCFQRYQSRCCGIRKLQRDRLSCTRPRCWWREESKERERAYAKLLNPAATSSPSFAHFSQSREKEKRPRSKLNSTKRRPKSPMQPLQQRARIKRKRPRLRRRPKMMFCHHTSRQRQKERRKVCPLEYVIRSIRTSTDIRVSPEAFR